MRKDSFHVLGPKTEDGVTTAGSRDRGRRCSRYSAHPIVRGRAAPVDHTRLFRGFDLLVPHWVEIALAPSQIATEGGNGEWRGFF
jgi:hypothetical protein